jgi:hypothetical protein
MTISTATVKLVTGSRINATIATANGQIQASAPVTLTTRSNRLDLLDDVVETTPQDGMSLIYRASDDKYVVQQVSLENVAGALDGGTF